ncbi:MAG TPA: GNAT family N-acetyltransferase [Urbifossiella sp.]|jgi:GNAT superfamily N-acetyltransferase|nr:GNAT family N-acetyltransferase [Urbifossiella sp.]
MFRPITPADTIPLVELTARTGVFKPLELAALREVFDDYYTENRALGHRSFLWVERERPRGYVYFAPIPMTEGTWSLYWIAVEPEQQGRGLGRKLLEFVEVEARERRGRLLLIDTSTLPRYEATRQFYVRNGYSAAAHIPDYYAEDDGLIIFSKRL